MPHRDLIVVGASAGGVEALRELVSALPANFGGAICVVLHIPPAAPSVLHRILGRAGLLRAEVPGDGERLRRGRIYVAPPDRHLVIHRGHMRLIRGPRENGHRPAIDALFRSAARAYGPAVAGVILTGNLGDGALGLKEVKRMDGIAIVQSPDEALYPSMPRNAIANVEIDHVLPLADIAPLLIHLAGEASENAGPIGSDWEYSMSEKSNPDPERHAGDAKHLSHFSRNHREPMPDDVEVDLDVRAVDGGARVNEHLGGTVSGYTCPECHGALWEIHDGTLVRFRCRVGHSYSEPALLDHKSESLEAALWTALTALEESASIARRMADRSAVANHTAAVKRYEGRAELLERRSTVIRDVLEDIPIEGVAEDAVE